MRCTQKQGGTKGEPDTWPVASFSSGMQLSYAALTCPFPIQNTFTISRVISVALVGIRPLLLDYYDMSSP
ncbi:unnamed protein product [Nezara viridula]|uniref:Uncharacterized protein n=1 Tax=Nezara viridula TaxID=85310 RepID=A0A9P0EGX7_NEZVI|nr:unnamed protein product [Nezara viridula]